MGRREADVILNPVLFSKNARHFLAFFSSVQTRTGTKKVLVYFFVDLWVLMVMKRKT